MVQLARLLFALMVLYASALAAHPGASSVIEHYTHEIEHAPEDPSLYLRRGIAYSNDGRYALALEDFEEAQKFGKPVLVDFDLGVLHYRRGELELARVSFDRYLKAFPDHPACLEYRARVRRDTGDHAGAVADFQRVFALQERPNPGHYISVSNLLEESGDAGVERALTVLDSGTKKLGITPQLQKHAIVLELRRDRPDLAIQRLDTLRPMLGESPDWKVDMAQLQLLVGNKQTAEQLLEQASGQLESLRKTPARLALKARIAGLQQPD